MGTSQDLEQTSISLPDVDDILEGDNLISGLSDELGLKDYELYEEN